MACLSDFCPSVPSLFVLRNPYPGRVPTVAVQNGLLCAPRVDRMFPSCLWSFPSTLHARTSLMNASNRNPRPAQIQIQSNVRVVEGGVRLVDFYSSVGRGLVNGGIMTDVVWLGCLNASPPPPHPSPRHRARYATHPPEVCSKASNVLPPVHPTAVEGCV